GKTLVVYFSATGSTKAVAEKISDATNGDIFELVPQTPYTSEDLDWNNTESRVTKEHEDESKRDVALNSTSVDNWDSYDTVFIGYPIWWGIAAWPVNSFVKENDFSGKTVIPFCTSASSDIGDSGSLLKEMVGTGNWQSGQRFASNASDDDVKAWLGQLGY
ncbi:MAG: flavodoxin, partial [Ruminococcus sp.]|nr:flavodoxin [Ruminococcus sp.]